jgi:hypothetical protein
MPLLSAAATATAIKTAPIWGPPLLNAVGNLGAGARNRKFIEEQNTADKEWTDFWNYQNRKWQVEDRDYMNQYNSPAQQMQRMKEAGLNPNLMYGKFDAGQMSPIATVRGQTHQGRVKQATNPLEGLNLQSMYYNTKIMEQEFRIKKIQADREAELFKEEMKDDYIFYSRANKSIYDYEFQRDKTELQTEALNRAVKFREVRNEMEMIDFYVAQQKAAKTEAEKLYMQKKLDVIKNEAIIKEIHAQLWDKGINPNSPFWLIALDKLIQEYTGIDVMKGTKK